MRFQEQNHQLEFLCETHRHFIVWLQIYIFSTYYFSFCINISSKHLTRLLK